MSFVLSRSSLGFCWWDLLALVALVVVIVFFVIRHKKVKDRFKELEEEVSTLYTADTVTQD